MEYGKRSTCARRTVCSQDAVDVEIFDSYWAIRV